MNASFDLTDPHDRTKRGTEFDRDPPPLLRQLRAFPNLFLNLASETLREFGHQSAVERASAVVDDDVEKAVLFGEF